LADQLVAAGTPILDEELISFILNGLNSPFTSFITTYSFAAREHQISFDDFQDELLSHEMLLNQQQTKATDSATFALTAQRPTNPQLSKGKGPMYPPARYAPRPYHPRPSHGFSARPPYHQYSRGPQPYNHHNHGTQFSQQQQYSQPNQQTSLSSTARTPNSGLLPTPPSNFFTNNTRVPCQICGKTSHLAIDCYHRMDYAFQGRNPPAQLAAMVAHTNALENLHIQQPFQHNDEVAVGNGTGLTIESTGSSLIHTPTSSFQLNNILHCPQASANLLSIQKFCLDNSCYFILTSSHYFVKDLRTHVTLLEGKSENGLYPLRFEGNLHKGTKTFTALLGIRTTSLMWHFRLGHPSLDIVHRVVKDRHLLVSKFNFNKTSACNSCQLGKGKRQPFPHSTRVSLQPLDLIHSDVWTSPVTSISGCKYHVIFIDDFSRYTWIYPLYNKSEVFDSFVKFKLLVENQFSSKIKQLQSDGGGEYTSNHFQSFLTKKGILHRKSCPHTSQQNGLAERKLRHILETSLTLLAHSHLSNKYWVDAFLTAIHVINRLPTPTLQFFYPFFKLYNREPNYQELRVFGCLCYPLLRPYDLHKLEYRSKPCIFLGYHHAGYKCLDPVTNKVYLSRHVVFNEDSFPAKDQAVSLLPSKVCAQNDAPFILPVQFLVLNLPQTASNFSPVSPSPAAPSSPPISPPIATSSPSRSQPPAAPTPHIPQPHAASPSPVLSPTAPSLADPCLPHSSSISLQPSSPSPTTSIPPPPSVSLLPPNSMVTRSRTGSL
jgi:transposase InsO family protein